MNCSKCGTPISDKALVCYRCGAPTGEPHRPVQAADPRRGRSIAASALALVVLVLGALYLGQAQGGEIPRAVSWTVAALGAVAIAWWLMARRRRG